MEKDSPLKKKSSSEYCKFIYLMPGNWFELKNIISSKTQPYDIDMLKSEILSQVKARAEKLDFVNTCWKSVSPNAAKEEIEFYLDPERFNRISQVLKNETRHPIITFHGTKPSVINSILKHGYIMPHDKNAIVAVGRAHGSLYGNGIYSSPFFDKANCYATPDDKSCVYILINMLFPGKATLIPPYGYLNRSDPINGVFPENTNTRIVYGLDQIISADPTRIIPIAVMKITITR